MEKEIVGADFYTDDYGGDYYDVYGGGGGGDYGGGDIGVGGDFNYGYGFDVPGTISPGVDAIAWGGTDFNYGYGFDQGLPPDYAPGFETYNAYLDLYLGQGLDYAAASNLAEMEAAQGSILTETYEPGTTQLPDLSEQYFPLPYVTDYWQSPPYIPNFGDEQYFPLPLPPETTQPNLPPYCPAGQYHPYPIGHPQQNLCVPFPQATTQAPKPPGATSGAPPPVPKPPSQQPKPPSQQQCPQGYYRTANGQCLPIPRCTTPGTVFDQARGICVPQGQAVSPLPIPSEAKDLWANLKELPWWVWVALGGLLLLGKDDGGGKKTTVTYRRAR